MLIPVGFTAAAGSETHTETHTATIETHTASRIKL